MGALWNALLCFNASVILLYIAFAPRKTSVSWSSETPLIGNYFVASMEWGNLALVVIVSLLLSIGVYGLVGAYVKDETKAVNNSPLEVRGGVFLLAWSHLTNMIKRLSIS